MKSKRLIVGIIMALAVFVLGCGMDINQLPGLNRSDIEDELIKVDIMFTDGQSLTTFVRSLGISNQGKVFVGGSSVSYFYDGNGNILGSYNYQRVLYMRIVTEEDS